MENMDKGVTVPKQVLIVWPKIPQNLSAQLVCPSLKVLDFNESPLEIVSTHCTLVKYERKVGTRQRQIPAATLNQ